MNHTIIKNDPTHCSKCLRHISELEPFEEFNGAKLIKSHKVLVAFNEEMETILMQIKYTRSYQLNSEAHTLRNIWHCSNFKELEKMYGREKLHQAYIYDLTANSIVTVLECRECFMGLQIK